MPLQVPVCVSVKCCQQRTLVLRGLPAPRHVAVCAGKGETIHDTRWHVLNRCGVVKRQNSALVTFATACARGNFRQLPNPVLCCVSQIAQDTDRWGVFAISYRKVDCALQVPADEVSSSPTCAAAGGHLHATVRCTGSMWVQQAAGGLLCCPHLP